MTRFFAFLRAVNVGGRVVKMDHLKAIFVSLGFHNIQTYIASGNVIFESDSDDTLFWENKIESYLLEKLGYEIIVFIRTADEIKNIAYRNTVTNNESESFTTLNIAFLKEPLDAVATKKLLSLRSAIDDFRIQGREVYWLCQKKQSESTFSNSVFERKLKLKTTLRGFATISKIADKYIT